MTKDDAGNPERSQRKEREERMRYEVLLMLYTAAQSAPGDAVQAWGWAQDLGVWHEELFRVFEFLDRAGLIEYLGAGPLVRITQAGIDYIESEGKRRSIRG